VPLKQAGINTDEYLFLDSHIDPKHFMDSPFSHTQIKGIEDDMATETPTANQNFISKRFLRI